MNSPGIIVISMDLEKRWGVHDLYLDNFEIYKNNIFNIDKVVDKTLQMFDEYQIRATWAAVGALALDSWEDYFNLIPNPANYTNKKLIINRSYRQLKGSENHFFGSHLLRNILSAVGQDLGSHTFSHLYFQEEGLTKDDFLNDSKMVEYIWKGKLKTQPPSSLVFPRNQVNYLESISDTSIRIYRSVEKGFYNNDNSTAANNLISRAMRLVDSIYPYQKKAEKINVNNTRASLFIRFNLPVLLWKMQLERINYELDQLGEGEIFHIWWHPENLGDDLIQSFNRLESIITIISGHLERGRVVSKNMADLLS